MKRLWVVVLLILVFVSCTVSYFVISELLFPSPKVCTPELFDKEQQTLTQILPIGKNVEPISHIGGAVNEVFIRNAQAFVKISSEFVVLDVSNPSRPVKVNGLVINGNLVDVNPNNPYALILDKNSLWRIDFSNIADLIPVHLYTSPVTVQDIRISGDKAYLKIRSCKGYSILPYTGFSKCRVGLYVVNVSKPIFSTTPTKCYGGRFGNILSNMVMWYLPKNNPKKAVAENYAYIAKNSDGLQILDISDPNEPVEVSTYTVPHSPRHVVLSGEYAYIADIGRGLRIVNIANPINPVEVGFYNLEGELLQMTIQDRYMYMAEYSAQGGVRVMDMVNPVHPLEIGFYRTSEGVSDIAVNGRYAYVAALDDGLRILDIENPTMPTEISSYKSGRVGDVEIVGDYAYITIRNRGMQVIDISNPLSPIAVGHFNTSDIPVELTVINDYAYVADWVGNLYIVDVSHPKSPVQIGTKKFSDRVQGITIVNDTAYIITGDGLHILDVSDPTKPIEIGSKDALRFTGGLAVREPYIYLTESNNGLFIFRSMLSDEAN